MSRDDLVKGEGVITATPGGGIYVVQLSNSKIVKCKLCGQMKRFRIRCIVGDSVTVGMSQYDLTKGLILFRQKPGRPPDAPPEG